MNFDIPSENIVDDQSLLSRAWSTFFTFVRNILVGIVQSGPTADRPDSTTTVRWIGMPYFDTNLNREVFLQSVNPDVWFDPVTTATSVSLGIQMLHVRDERANGTEGGTSIALAQNIRVLNTVVTNTITGASLASNQITLPAGTYRIEASAPAFAANRHKVRLRNITDSTNLVGESEYVATTLVQTRSTVSGRFIISGTKTFELQHYFEGAAAVNGLGVATSSGDVEVYASVKIFKE